MQSVLLLSLLGVCFLARQGAEAQAVQIGQYSYAAFQSRIIRKRGLVNSYCQDGRWDKLSSRDQFSRVTIEQNSPSLNTRADDESLYMCVDRYGRIQTLLGVIFSANYFRLLPMSENVKVAEGSRAVQVPVRTSEKLETLQLYLFLPDKSILRARAYYNRQIGAYQVQASMNPLSRRQFGTWVLIAWARDRKLGMTSFKVMPSSQPPERSQIGGNGRYSIQLMGGLNKNRGEQAEFYCVLSPADPSVTLYLYFGKMFKDVTNSRLIFPVLGDEHKDVLKCEAWQNGQMLAQSSTHNLARKLWQQDVTDYEMGPKGTFVYYMKNQSNFVVHCSSRTPSNVQWYKDDRPFRNTIDTYTTLGTTFKAMSFMKFSAADQGIYSCDRGLGTEMRYATFLLEKQPMSIEIGPDYPQDIGSNSPDVRIHCLLNHFEPDAKMYVDWFFSQIRMDGNMQRISQPPWRTDTLAEKTSEISTATKEPRFAGYYYCRHQTTGYTREYEVKAGSSPFNIKLEPSRRDAWVGQSFSLTCIGSPAFSQSITWTHNGQPIYVPSDRRYSERQISSSEYELTVTGAMESDAGTYHCIHGQTRSNPSAVSVRRQGCRNDQRKCLNGDCIEARQWCNGFADCSDRSDEDPSICRECDPIMRKCENYNGRQATKKVFQAHWYCDGEDDCGNNFDEYSCPVRFDRCNAKQFTCQRDQSGRSKVIPAGYVCDGENDCPYGDDEQGCGVPVVMPVEIANQRMTLNRYSPFTLSCSVAMRTAVPRIVWRINWMCLPEDTSQYTVRETYDGRCGQVNSTLTVNAIDSRYEGIYNCEALTNYGRAFSQDMHVTMNP